MTAQKGNLRAVADDEKPVKKRKTMSVKTAASTGTRRDLLVSLRDQIASDITAGVPARDLAALSKRLLEISNEVEAIDAEEAEDDIGRAAATPDEEWTAN